MKFRKHILTFARTTSCLIGVIAMLAGNALQPADARDRPDEETRAERRAKRIPRSEAHRYGTNRKGVPHPLISKKVLAGYDLTRTEKLIDSGDIKFGTMICKRNIRKNKEDPLWLTLYVRFRVHNGHYEKYAREAMIKAVKLAPKDDYVVGTYAMTKFFDRDYNGAKNIAKSTIQLNSRNVLGKAILLASQSCIDNPPVATLSPKMGGSEVTIALGDDEDDDTADSGSSKHVAKLTEEKAAAAITKQSDELVKIAENAGNSHDTYSLLASFFQLHANRMRMMQVINFWIKNNPKCAYAYYQRGRLNENFNKRKNACDDYAKALELNPSNTMALNRYAYNLLRTHKYQEAVDNYDLAEQLGGMLASSYGHRAEALVGIKDYKNAARDYTKALNTYIGETEPSKQLSALRELSKARQAAIRKIWVRRVECYFEAKRYDDAATDAKFLLMFTPGYTRAMDIRQKVYCAQKKYPLALKDLNDMIAISPKVSPWYKTRAEVYRKMGREKDYQADMKRYENLKTKGTLD